ncbi:MAG: DUF4271 domain-containing protein [Cyclobacteriaceae bacterium]
MYKILVLFISLLMLSGVNVRAQESQIKQIEDLKKNWLTYDGRTRSYVPFIEGSKLDRPYIGFYLDLKAYPRMLLQCCVPSGSGLYIENSLVDYASKSDCFLLNVDSLKNAYPQNQIFISLYRRNFDSKQFVTSIVVPYQEKVETTGSESEMILHSREQPYFTNFFIVALLILLAYYAALLNLYPKVFWEFFNVNKAFALKLKEEKVLTPSVFSRTNLLFFLGYGMVISFVGIVFWFVLKEIPILFSFVRLESFIEVFTSWVKLSVLVLIILCLKYFLMVIIGTLFNHRLIVPRHFYDFNRLSHIFLIIIFSLAIVAYMVLQNPPEILYRTLFYALAFLLSLRVLILFFKLLDSASFRNFHLFSYLCTTEILPLVIGIKIFL